jgi:hypothetical protein
VTPHTACSARRRTVDRAPLKVASESGAGFTLDAPNDEAVAKFVLSIGMRGNLATETLRAFNDDEVDALLGAL